MKEKALRFLRETAMRMQRMTYGRNGMDLLAKDLYVLSLILFVISLLMRNFILRFGALFLLGYVMFRVFSKNPGARGRENAAYAERKRKAQAEIRFAKRKWSDRRTYRYYVCPSCGRKLRVPKGRGKIEIHCPCGRSFEKRS